MIKSFRCKDAQAIFEGKATAKFKAFQHVVERKLTLLNNATTLDFLRSPPGNRLESLKGNRQGQYSIRINDQWRICFKWDDGNVTDVEIVDYH